MNSSIWGYIYEWLTNVYNFVGGVLMTILGYFLPIKDIMSFMLVLLFSVVIITLLFIWDDVYKQEFIKTYSVAGWFVSGLLIASISENAYKITGWNVLSFLNGFVTAKIVTDFRNLKL